jgi:transcription elongation factor GreA
MSDEIYLTLEGIEKLKTELDYLKGEAREQIAERLRAAIQMGDLSENADYTSAKEDQAFIEGRIQELEMTLKKAVVIEASGEDTDTIRIGSRVTVREEGYAEETFHIIGSKEADPDNGKISYESPIGRALLNHSVGDIVRVETPSGDIIFKIIDIK